MGSSCRTMDIAMNVFCEHKLREIHVDMFCCDENACTETRSSFLSFGRGGASCRSWKRGGPFRPAAIESCTTIDGAVLADAFAMEHCRWRQRPRMIYRYIYPVYSFMVYRYSHQMNMHSICFCLPLVRVFNLWPALLITLNSVKEKSWNSIFYSYIIRVMQGDQRERAPPTPQPIIFLFSVGGGRAWRVLSRQNVRAKDRERVPALLSCCVGGSAVCCVVAAGGWRAQ